MALAFLCVFLTSVNNPSFAADIDFKNMEHNPVEFAADNLVYDEENQIVVATGNVELTSGLKIVRADNVSYNLAKDSVEAQGSVTLLDEEGNVVFADHLELHNDMKDGFIKELLALLSDGSRITAAYTKRENNGMLITMKKASYTVCEVCEAEPNPMWQIKAGKVIYDKEEAVVSYKNARMEFLGVPLIYVPYFAHPDPTIERKSGLLRPSYGWSDALGAHLDMSYYYTIAPNRDVTLNVMPTTSAGTLLGGEYRERFSKGEVKIQGSWVESDRIEYDGRIEKDRSRGHIQVAGLFNIDEEWRGGVDFTRSSDKQYLRLYDISDEDVLTNEIYVENFSGRDYAKISLLNFQDVRLDSSEEQPDILPYVRYNWLGEPDGVFGGRWSADASLMAMHRGEDEQDMQRISFGGAWQRKDTTSFGLVNTYKLNTGADFYAIQNSDAHDVNPSLDENPFEYRVNAMAGIQSSYPLIRPVFNKSAKVILEPIVGVNFSPRQNMDEDEIIPNEDSIDVRFDSNNLFDDNRFPGIDMVEDGGRANFGLKTSFYDDDGNYGKFFIGQSYRMYGDAVYPEGSGLEERLSDFVGQLKLGFGTYLDADYRFQFDNDNFNARRHEVQASGQLDPIRFGLRYIYVDSVAGTGFDEAREQVYLENLYRIDERWSVNSSALLDIGDDPGFRNASAGLSFIDDCFAFHFEGKRNIANDASGEDDTSFVFRVGLKNIGEFDMDEFLLGDIN